MHKSVDKYISVKAISQVQELLNKENLILKVKPKRKSKHGDYKKMPNGKHQITVNDNLNPYRFLMTLLHEIAHFEAFQTYGNLIKPHGKEWKHTFQRIMLPFIRPEIFPEELLPLLALHFKNPKASSNSDEKLYRAMRRFDPPNDKCFIFELPLGEKFVAENGKIYQKGKQRRKRFECIELGTKTLWLFNPNAEVDLLQQHSA